MLREYNYSSMSNDQFDRFGRRSLLKSVGAVGLAAATPESAFAGSDDSAEDEVEFTLTVTAADGTTVGTTTITDSVDVDEFGNRVKIDSLGDWAGDGDHAFVDSIRYADGEVIESWERRDLSDYSITSRSSGSASVVSTPTAHGERAVRLDTGSDFLAYTSDDDLVTIEGDTEIEGAIRHETDASSSFAMKTGFSVGCDETGAGGIIVRLTNPGRYRTAGATIRTPNSMGRIEFTPELGEFYTFGISVEDAGEEAELEIDDHRPVQVVFEPYASGDNAKDFVAGKATAVLVYPGGSNLEALDRNVTIRTEVVDVDDEVVSSDESELTPSQYRELAANGEYVEQRLKVPDPEIVSIESKLIPGDNRAQTISSPKVTEEILVLETKKLGLAFYQMEPSMLPATPDFEAVSTSDFVRHIIKCDELLPPRFPVAEDNYDSNSNGRKTASRFPGDYGLSRTFQDLQLWAWAQSDGYHGVGVVTKEFFKAYGRTSDDGEVVGLTPKESTLGSMLVTARYYSTNAHELGHQYGLHTGKEEYDYDGGEMEYDDPELIDGKDYGKGYWVDKSKLMRNAPAFMGSGMKDREDWWLSNEKNYYGDFQDYNHLLDAMRNDGDWEREVSTENEDDILYMMGSVDKDGAIIDLESHFFEEGRLENIKDGPYTIVGSDSTDNVIIKQTFNVSFEFLASGTGSTKSPIETDIGSFALPIRFPLSVRTIKIVKENKVLKRYNATTSTLHQAIDGIPSDKFRGKDTEDSKDERSGRDEGKDKDDGNGKLDGELAENRRKALHNKVDALHRQLDAGNERGAIRKLEHDIRPAIERWVEPDYSTEKPDKYTRKKVLVIVERHIQRLS